MSTSIPGFAESFQSCLSVLRTNRSRLPHNGRLIFVGEMAPHPVVCVPRRASRQHPHATLHGSLPRLSYGNYPISPLGRFGGLERTTPAPRSRFKMVKRDASIEILPASEYTNTCYPLTESFIDFVVGNVWAVVDAKFPVTVSRHYQFLATCSPPP